MPRGDLGPRRMSSSDWIVLFDVRHADYQGLYFPLIGIVLIGIAFIGTRRKSFSRDPLGETVVSRGMPGSRRFLAFAVLWTVVSGVIVFGSHASLATALGAGRFTVIEGQVERVQEADLLRRRPEIWRVAGHTYQLHDARESEGFNSPGVVPPGSYVRIADVGGVIARLEIAR
jgi:hypothetical protein